MLYHGSNSQVLRWSLLVLLLAAVGLFRAAGSDHANVWTAQTKSAAVFKNGLGFFIEEGEVTLRDGWCVTEHIPPAAYGTFAAYSLVEGEIVDVIGVGPGELVEFDVDSDEGIQARRARLEAAVGLTVSLTYGDEAKPRRVQGSLASVGREYVVLETEASTLAAKVDEVASMQLVEHGVRLHVEGAADPNGVTRLAMAYLRKGITWIPEYTLNILDDESAELTLRGTVVNEADDLVDCDMQFVVGAPNFAHSDHLAPAAAGRLIRAVGVQVGLGMNNAIQTMNSFSFNGVFQNTDPNRLDVPSAAVDTGGGAIAAALGNLPSTVATAGTDYTVYTKEDLTVRKGERAIVTLFVKKIAYSHLYRWTPPGGLRHVLRLANNTGTPWTTGPCLAVSEGSPLSEDMLKYTPKGAWGELPVTTAINIAHESDEREEERKFKAHTISSGHHLDLVTLEGELSIKNYEERAIEVAVEKAVVGKPLSASDEGRMNVDTSELALSKRRGSIEWTITVDAGASKKLTYTYERYVRTE